VVIYSESQVLLQPLISTFGLSVCPRVICRGRVLLYVELCAQLPHELGGKSGVAIRDYLGWYAESGEYVIKI